MVPVFELEQSICLGFECIEGNLLRLSISTKNVLRPAQHTHGADSAHGSVKTEGLSTGGS